MIARNREDRWYVVGVGFIELRIVIVMHAGEIDDVAHMIAELRSRPVAQALDHLVSDLALKLTVLDAAGIADDMKHHFFRMRDRVTDRRKILHEIVVVRRQPERSRKRLEAGVAVGQWMQGSHAGVGLRLPGFGAGFDRAPVPRLSSLVSLD